MPTLRENIKVLLEADGTLSALLPGGWLDSEDLPQDEGGAGSLPRDTDGLTVLPFGVLRWRASNAYDHQKIGAERQSLETYFYAEVGSADLEAVVSRVKALLHETYTEGDDRALAHVVYTFTSGELPPDEHLGGASGQFSRYNIVFVRK